MALPRILKQAVSHRRRTPASGQPHHSGPWFAGDEKLTTALLDHLAHRATVIMTKGRAEAEGFRDTRSAAQTNRGPVNALLVCADECK